jgi:hypothetical protein
MTGKGEDSVPDGSSADVTIPFMPIGSYMLFNGILLSATLVARDSELRKEFYYAAMSQLNLKTIAVTKMEMELIKNSSLSINVLVP